MFCHNIGKNCPHQIIKDDNLIFLLMPFNGFTRVYNTILNAVNSIPNRKFKCDRADKKFTNHSIWCSRICQPIQSAKYIIADTTGKNPNVFYELGYAHALEGTATIIISQNIHDIPFDIKDLAHIEYSLDKLNLLKRKLISTIADLEVVENEEEIVFFKKEELKEIILDLYDLRKSQRIAIKKEQILGTIKRLEGIR